MPYTHSLVPVYRCTWLTTCSLTMELKQLWVSSLWPITAACKSFYISLTHTHTHTLSLSHTHTHTFISGVPAHDSRDLEFSREHNLPPPPEVLNSDGDTIINSYQVSGPLRSALSFISGFLTQFSGMSVSEGSKAIVDSAHNQGFGGHMTQYRLRDWLISRQRYWGAPIPVLHCDKCGVSDRERPPDEPSGENDVVLLRCNGCIYRLFQCWRVSCLLPCRPAFSSLVEAPPPSPGTLTGKEQTAKSQPPLHTYILINLCQEA